MINSSVFLFFVLLTGFTIAVALPTTTIPDDYDEVRTNDPEPNPLTSNKNCTTDEAGNPHLEMAKVYMASPEIFKSLVSTKAYSSSIKTGRQQCRDGSSCNNESTDDDNNLT